MPVTLSFLNHLRRILAVSHPDKFDISKMVSSGPLRRRQVGHLQQRDVLAGFDNAAQGSAYLCPIKFLISKIVALVSQCAKSFGLGPPGAGK